MEAGTSINDNESLDLRKLREMAKAASIYHRNRSKFRRNRNLSHVVHASLHLFQFIIGMGIVIFHYSHHRINRNRIKEDDSVPEIPEEANGIFCVYPLCMIMSFVFAFLWLFTEIFTKNPRIVLVGCFAAAALMLIAGIIEMKHVDMYLDLTVITDKQLLSHPVFLHNFALCLLSIFCMTIYLLQGWILFDYHLWIKQQRETSDDMEMSDSDTIEEPREDGKKKKEAPGELDPIPTLETFPSFTISEALSVEKEEVILYCCFVDCYNYIKHSREMGKPLHEFQVVHVL